MIPADSETVSRDGIAAALKRETEEKEAVRYFLYLVFCTSNSVKRLMISSSFVFSRKSRQSPTSRLKMTISARHLMLLSQGLGNSTQIKEEWKRIWLPGLI